MIQAITETAFKGYIQTEDNRIDTSVPSSQIQYLFKFTNDMDKSVSYAYANSPTIYDRFTVMVFAYNASPDLYSGEVKLLPSGYWKYEVYEVSWQASSYTIRVGFAPANENDVLDPAADNKGVVQGLVTKGKLYLADKDGTAQVQYTQRQEPTGTNYIYYGQ